MVQNLAPHSMVEILNGRKKWQYLWFGGDGKGEMRLLGEKLEKAKEFKYMGSFIIDIRGLEREVGHKIQAGCINWKRVPGVFYNKRIKRINGKIFKSLVKAL